MTMFSEHKVHRALTDMTAAYTPLRNLIAVDEELKATFVTPEGSQFDAWICFPPQQNLLDLWVQDRNWHAETLHVENFIWIPISQYTSANLQAKVLFGRKPLRTGHTCMQLIFKHDRHMQIFMDRINLSGM